MTDTVLQSIFASGSILNLQGNQREEEHTYFPGSKNEEALIIFAKIGKYLEGKGDWLKCDGLFDAVVSLVKESTEPKSVEEKPDLIGHERDPSYFNEPITMSISLNDVKKYLTDIAKGDIEICFESNEFIQSPYHLQRLAVLKLEKLFPPESSFVSSNFFQDVFYAVGCHEDFPKILKHCSVWEITRDFEVIDQVP